MPCKITVSYQGDLEKCLYRGVGGKPNADITDKRICTMLTMGKRGFTPMITITDNGGWKGPNVLNINDIICVFFKHNFFDI